jgi:hypothetical protein
LDFLPLAIIFVRRQIVQRLVGPDVVVSMLPLSSAAIRATSVTTSVTTLGVITNHDLPLVGDMGCHTGEIKVLGKLLKQIGAQKETGKGER